MTEELDSERVSEVIGELFSAAREADEFEFACALLRVKGLEEPGWDPYSETHALVSDLTSLISAPLQGTTQIRLGLLLYSHLTEVDTIYAMLANLLRIVQGERCVTDPFSNPPNLRNVRLWPPSAAMVHRWLYDDLRAGGWSAVAETLEWFFDEQVRNAFSHADYIIHGDKIRSRAARFEIDGIITGEMPLERFTELLNRALVFFDAVAGLHHDQRTSYREPMEVTGRFGSNEERIPIRLLADAERGLYGFESSTDDTAKAS